MNFEQARKVLVAAAKAEGISEYEIYYMQGESMSADTLKDLINQGCFTVVNVCDDCYISDILHKSFSSLCSR